MTTPSAVFLRMRRAAVAHLKRSDPVMAGIVRRVGPCRFAPKTAPPFRALAEAIMYQQLNGKAASTILRRFTALYAPKRFPSPEDVLATPEGKIRAAGVSRQKLSYLRDLAGKAASKDVRLASLHRLKDEEIIGELTRIKGVGVWTAHMYLMFRLGRPDVLPTGDYGICKAAQLAYGMRTPPTPVALTRKAAPWRPYASFASWYLWRSLDDK